MLWNVCIMTPITKGAKFISYPNYSGSETGAAVRIPTVLNAAGNDDASHSYYLLGCKLIEQRQFSAATRGCPTLVNTSWGLRSLWRLSISRNNFQTEKSEMTTRSEREKAQKLNEQHQAILSKLLREDDNKYCADCEAKGKTHIADFKPPSH